MVSTLTVLHEKHYQQVPLKDLKEQFGAQKVFPAAEWRKLFADGTVTKWLQQVTDFFVATGNIQNAVQRRSTSIPRSSSKRPKPRGEQYGGSGILRGGPAIPCNSTNIRSNGIRSWQRCGQYFLCLR